MSSRRLRARTPSARFVTVATLSHHELRFHKRSHDGSSKCDAFKTGDSTHGIIGVIFDIADHEMQILDRFEGLGRGYEKKTVSITDHAADNIEACTYYATDIDTSLRPYRWYWHHVLTGAREHALPEDYISHIERTISTDDPDIERHASEMAIYDELHVESS